MIVMKFGEYISLHIRSLKEPGMMAFILHRITGILIIIYLFAHIMVISSVIAGSGTFDDVLKVLQSPPVLLFDLGLLVVVTFHAVNGVRIMLFDLGIGISRQKELFYISLGITIVIGILATHIIFPIFLKRAGW